METLNRFVAASRRREEKLKGLNEPEVRAQNKEISKDATETQRSTKKDEKAGIGSERVVAERREHTRKTSQKNRASSSGRARRKTKEEGGSPGGKDEKEAGQEVEKWRVEPEAIFLELRKCSIFHDV